MRAFVAVDLPFSDALVELVGARLEQFHLTLRFLGEIPADRAAALSSAVRAAADTQPPFDLELAGVGAFPNDRAPRVVWVGIGAGREASATLARRISEALTAEGFPPEDREFQPHATLFRVRSPPDRARAERALDAGRGRIFGRTRVEELGAYASELTPSGAIHRRFFSARLGGPE